jgi:hypothetical protein
LSRQENNESHQYRMQWSLLSWGTFLPSFVALIAVYIQYKIAREKLEQLLAKQGNARSQNENAPNTMNNDGERSPLLKSHCNPKVIPSVEDDKNEWLFSEWIISKKNKIK